MPIDQERAKRAIARLREYQQDYPDYDALDWCRAVKKVFTRESVRKVATYLAVLSDDSLRGIEASQDNIATATNVAQKTVSRAVTDLTSADYLLVAKRFPKSDGTNVTQRADSYTLVIPGAPTWGMSKDELREIEFPRFVAYSDQDNFYPPWDKSPEGFSAGYEQQLLDKGAALYLEFAGSYAV